MVIIEYYRKICRKTSFNWRIILIILCVVFLLIAIGKVFTTEPGIVVNGKVDLSRFDFKQNELVQLDGQWEFYWDRLLMQEDFIAEQKPQIDSLMKVPGAWNDGKAGNKIYPNHGVATYRLIIKYPATLLDPALNIKTVSAAYKLYANGQLITEVGKVSDKLSSFEGDYKQLIVNLPKDKQELELIFQVANLDYIRGGLRDSLIFGSKQSLEHQKMLLLAIQLIFIGGVFIYGIHYFILFFLQPKNKTALIFSIICFITALRASVWGETPIMVILPQMSIKVGLFINYITEYNLIPVIILFVLSIYPMDYKKKILGIILLPTLFFDALLLAPAGFRASFNSYYYILMLLQMIYVLGVLIKAVLCKRDNAVLMLMAIGVFILTIIAFLLTYEGIGIIKLSYIFLFGNLAVIIAMSYVQAKQQADDYKKLILYNEQLVEADRLKDKIMSTEMSFLQAQIKPHFLYNALNAIANVCEKDGKKAGKLIVDLAIYLRGSLEFNNLDKIATIEKELEFVDTYFNIEQARFGEKIRLLKEIEVPLDYQIPVLVLQPLVENAIRHGISKKIGGGTIYVRMKQIDEGICLEIEDNGVGINSEKLATLLIETREGQGVGLINIHHRLLRLYNKGIDISSEVGRGTCVRLVIPEGKKQL